MPFLRNGLAFITLPILTSYLTPADYGAVGLVTIVSSFGALFFCGVSTSAYRYYFKYKDSPEELNAFFSTLLFYIMGGAALYLGALAAAHPLLNKYLLSGRVSFGWLAVGFLQVFLNYLGGINQYVFQGANDGRRWFFNEAVFTAVYVGLSLALVIFTPLRFEALLAAGAAAELLKTGRTFWQLRALYSIRFSRAMLREALGYSWPQVPSGVINFTYTYLDRLIMSRVQGLSQVGVLDMSARVASTVKMAVDGIGGVLSPKTIELLKEGTPDSGRRLAAVCLKALAAVLCLSLLVILFSKELVLLLMRGDFRQVIYVAPLYVYSQVFGALGLLSYWLIYYHTGKTWLQIPILVVGLISGTLLNVFLIPRYGLMGAAAAMFLTTGIVQTVQFFIGLKYTPVPFDLGKIGLLFGGLVAETAFIYVLYSFGLGLAAEIGIKLAMFGAYLWLCFRLQAVNRQDILAAWDMVYGKIAGLLGTKGAAPEPAPPGGTA